MKDINKSEYWFLIFIFISQPLFAFDFKKSPNFKNVYIDKACIRKMDISMHPIEKKYILHVQFNQAGLCDKKKDYKIKLSSNLKLVSSPTYPPRFISNMRHIMLGNFSNDWYSDLMYVFDIQDPSINGRIAIKLLDLSKKKYDQVILGGQLTFKVPVKVSHSSRNNWEQKYLVWGLYLDDPNSLNKLGEKYSMSPLVNFGNDTFFAELFQPKSIVLNRVLHYYKKSDHQLLKKNINIFIKQVKSVSPNTKVSISLPSWKFNTFDEVIGFVNNIEEINAVAFDWESNYTFLSRYKVRNIFSKVRQSLNKNKKLSCVVNAVPNRRGAYWSDIASYCDSILPMFYVPQFDKLLDTAEEIINKWDEVDGIDKNKIIPIIIPIHKNTTHTKMPTEFTKKTIQLLQRHGFNNFFIYRPYTLNYTDLSLFETIKTVKTVKTIKNQKRIYKYEKMCFNASCIFDQ